MCAGKPASAHIIRKGRKKSGKNGTGLNFSQSGQQSRSIWHQGDRKAPIMNCSLEDKEMEDLEMNMDTSESHNHFPFHLLPDLCKFRIWSFLKQCDLGRCMLVCIEWHMKIQKPQLWNTIHFNELPYTCLPHDRTGLVHTEGVCHHCFRKRVVSFSHFLSHIHPVVKEFQFCLDISHPTDQFNAVVEQFLSTADLTSLTYADINWKDSPSRAPLTNNQEPIQDYMYRYRRRQRLFSRLFDTFIGLATQLTTLVMPFDWTDYNVKNVCSLTKLENLVLVKYGVHNHTFTQDHINKLTESLVQLKKLLLEVWIPSYNNNNFELFYVESASLILLDVSLCRGFYIKRLNTPNLLQLRIPQRPLPMNMIQRQSPHLPCLFPVLSVGVPKLENINGHQLKVEDILNPPDSLNNLLTMLCCCTRHKSRGIEMYGM